MYKTNLKEKKYVENLFLLDKNDPLFSVFIFKLCIDGRWIFERKKNKCTLLTIERQNCN